MNKPVTFFIENIKGKKIYKTIRNKESEFYKQHLTQYGGKPILSGEETNQWIIEQIRCGKPLMVCRFGSNELATVKTFDFEVKRKYTHQLDRAHRFTGLFPETEEIGRQFAERMKDDIPSADLIGIWPQPYEEYYIKKYGASDLKCTWLGSLEPWSNPENPWTKALAGKTVLVVHPFTDSIHLQYQKREQLFPGTGYLPDFRLITLRSVQTAAGEEDPRFSSWFEALEWMKREIMVRDFDIAILGCGAYGFPLAAEIKKAGKQAVHLGGATQLLFGITGGRWDNDPVIQMLVNDAWVRPMPHERPIDSEKIENNCYW